MFLVKHLEGTVFKYPVSIGYTQNKTGGQSDTNYICGCCSQL